MGHEGRGVNVFGQPVPLLGRRNLLIHWQFPTLCVTSQLTNVIDGLALLTRIRKQGASQWTKPSEARWRSFGRELTNSVSSVVLAGVWPEEDNTHGVFEIEVAIGHLDVRRRKAIEALCPDTDVEFIQVDSFPDGSNPSDDEVVEFLRGAMPGTFDIEGEVSIFLPHCWVVFGGRAHDVSLIRLRALHKRAEHSVSIGLQDRARTFRHCLHGVGEWLGYRWEDLHSPTRSRLLP